MDWNLFHTLVPKKISIYVLDKTVNLKTVSITAKKDIIVIGPFGIKLSTVCSSSHGMVTCLALTGHGDIDMTSNNWIGPVINLVIRLSGYHPTLMR